MFFKAYNMCDGKFFASYFKINRIVLSALGKNDFSASKNAK